jgi:hypothetical protein
VAAVICGRFDNNSDNGLGGLSGAFSYTLGPDDIDELERLLGAIPKWAHDKRTPP